VSGGGDCLVFMATDASLAGRSGAYYNNDLDGRGTTNEREQMHAFVSADASSLFLRSGGHKFEAVAPSAEAQRDEEAAALWALSAQLVGLPA
jgi:hypothetical protein